ncbi:MAG: serine/threonine-protein phosphatase [Oscillospiraceae bacterium]|nr:serine/threonine-protein phosphatase [Oscillospiraceae bacterium]
MLIDSFLYTSQGGREENQDCVGRELNENAGLFVVADGLGGHQKGRLASKTVVNSLRKAWKEEPFCDADGILSRIADANQAVLRLQEEQNCNAKSTVVALAIDGERAVWAHTGDSRLYSFGFWAVHPLTEDHSVAYKKYKAGEIRKDEIAKDEDQSSLLRALGNENRWNPDIGKADNLKKGTGFLLCSDGFWEYIREEEMLKDFRKAHDSEDWAARMMDRAEPRFGKGNDNFSLITIILR